MKSLLIADSMTKEWALRDLHLDYNSLVCPELPKVVHKHPASFFLSIVHGILKVSEADVTVWVLICFPGKRHGKLLTHYSRQHLCIKSILEPSLLCMKHEGGADPIWRPRLMPVLPSPALLTPKVRRKEGVFTKTHRNTMECFWGMDLNAYVTQEREE